MPQVSVSDDQNLIDTIAEAFVMRWLHDLEEYSWVDELLYDLVVNDKPLAYKYLTAIIERGPYAVIKMAAISHMQKLFDAPTSLIVQAAMQDAQKSESMRYALAWAFCDGIATDNLAWDQQLTAFAQQMDLAQYCRESVDMAWTVCSIETFELKLAADPRAYNDQKDLAFELISKDENNRIKISGNVPRQDICHWHDELKKVHAAINGSSLFKIGLSPHATVHIAISKTGTMFVKVYFWINKCLMPERVDLEVDQSYLNQFLASLKAAIESE